MRSWVGPQNGEGRGKKVAILDTIVALANNSLTPLVHYLWWMPLTNVSYEGQKGWDAGRLGPAILSLQLLYTSKLPKRLIRNSIRDGPPRAFWIQSSETGWLCCFPQLCSQVSLCVPLLSCGALSFGNSIISHLSSTSLVWLLSIFMIHSALTSPRAASSHTSY